MHPQFDMGRKKSSVKESKLTKITSHEKMRIRLIVVIVNAIAWKNQNRDTRIFCVRSYKRHFGRCFCLKGFSHLDARKNFSFKLKVLIVHSLNKRTQLIQWCLSNYIEIDSPLINLRTLLSIQFTWMIMQYKHKLNSTVFYQL